VVTRICVEDGALHSIRLVASPLWEAIGSLTMMARWRGEVPRPYDGWGARARRALTGAMGTTLLGYFHGLHGRLPSFMVPMPRRTGSSMNDQLSMLRAVTADDVREELADRFPSGPPTELATFQTDPGGSLDRYITALTSYWVAAIRPYWTGMRAALAEEVLQQTRVLAMSGPDVLLHGLPRDVRWERPWLSLASGVAQETIRCSRELTLVPLLFARGPLIVVHNRAGAVAMSYQARGVALFEEPPPRAAARMHSTDPVRGDRLAILLGRSRARVLRAVAMPTTTSSLASELGLSASTVSEHLTALLAAGVVQRRRTGVRVLYELDPIGVTLLEHLGG
jgi:DNA-binding transcriptional ArsR family regulator